MIRHDTTWHDMIWYMIWLAKEAAGKNIISYNRIPICEIAQQLGEMSLKKWQMQWDRTTKALTTKELFPNTRWFKYDGDWLRLVYTQSVPVIFEPPCIKGRLNTKITLTPNFTAFVTSHGKTKSYLHRFKIIESPDCPCRGEAKRLTTFYLTAPFCRMKENDS